MSRFAKLFGKRRAPRAHWPEAWQDYPGWIDDRPAVWLVDLGAIEAAPVIDLPVRLDVRAHYAEDPQGLPTAGALAGLAEIDAVVRAAATDRGGVYVGRVCSGGLARFTAHLPAGDAPPMPDRVGAADTITTALEAGTEYDPHWAYVRDRLAPDDRQVQILQNQMVIRSLESDGDVPTASREVEHTGLFAEPELAEGAAAELRADGFTVRIDRDDEGGYALFASRVDAVVPPAVHDLVWSVKETVERHGGSYDGWGCMVTPDAPGPAQGHLAPPLN